MRKITFPALLFSYALLFVGMYHLRLPSAGFVGGYIDDASLVLLLSFFLHFIFLLHAKIRSLVLYTTIIIMQLVMVGEWWNYEFYRDYIHYSSLGYAGNWREILRGLSGFQGRYLALLVSAVLIILLWFVERHFKRSAYNKRTLIFACVFFGISGVVLAGTIAKVYADITLDAWQTKGHFPLEVKNPVLELAREKFIGKNRIARVTHEHISALSKLYGSNIDASPDKNFPFYASRQSASPDPVPAKKLNVLFIVLESFRGFETGEHNGLSLTPNFDRISKGNFTPEYFYTNSNQTIKAEIAVLCGVHDFVIGTSISAYDMDFNARCLPKIFQENGYNSLWFHGGYSSFYSRDTFFPKLGFNQMHDRKVIEESLYASGKNYFIRHWGVEDPYVYDYAFNELEKQQQPFFAEIMSLSSHHPFFDIENRWPLKDFPKQIQGDMHNMYRKYEYATYYTDKALGQFWDAFSKSPLYNNTIVMIVGDHGIWLFPDGMEEHAPEAQLYEAYTRLPLTIYFPGKHFSKPVQMPLSQVDIPRLITAYMGLDEGTGFQSGLNHDEALALLNEQPIDQAKSNPVFATIGDGYFYRQGNMRCFPTIASKGGCNDYLFRCVKQHNELQESQHCFTWEGELLRDASVTARPAEVNLGAADAVVDYFRNALFVGTAPRKAARQIQ